MKWAALAPGLSRSGSWWFALSILHPIQPGPSLYPQRSAPAIAAWAEVNASAVPQEMVGGRDAGSDASVGGVAGRSGIPAVASTSSGPLPIVKGGPGRNEYGPEPHRGRATADGLGSGRRAEIGPRAVSSRIDGQADLLCASLVDGGGHAEQSCRTARSARGILPRLHPCSVESVMACAALPMAGRRLVERPPNERVPSGDNSLTRGGNRRGRLHSGPIPPKEDMACFATRFARWRARPRGWCPAPASWANGLLNPQRVVSCSLPAPVLPAPGQVVKRPRAAARPKTGGKGV